MLGEAKSGEKTGEKQSERERGGGDEKVKERVRGENLDAWELNGTMAGEARRILGRMKLEK